jgi:hypothetical protein
MYTQSPNHAHISSYLPQPSNYLSPLYPTHVIPSLLITSYLFPDMFPFFSFTFSFTSLLFQPPLVSSVLASSFSSFPFLVSISFVPQFLLV